MRKALSLLAVLSLMLLVLNTGVTRSAFNDQEDSASNALRTMTNWFDLAWHWRKPIAISNSGGSLTDYQLKVVVNTQELVANGKMQSDGDDIRFTAGDKVTEIPYWIESGINTSATVIWVKVASIPTGDSIIYIYYGNDDASAGSNGTTTFAFFDDFSGDLSKWNIHVGTNIAITPTYGNPAPSLEISGGVKSSPYGFAVIGSDATYTGFQDGIIEADIYPSTEALPEIIFRGNYAANTGYKGRWDCRTGNESPWMKPPYNGWQAFGTAVARFGIADQWQEAKLVVHGSTFEIYSNDSLKSMVTDTQHPGPGEIGFANHYGAYSRLDNIRVRKYASTEPAVTDIGAEE
jgi:hypothetical protein